MRIFLIWSDTDPELVTLMQALNRAPHRLVYWLGHSTVENHNQSGTIYHSHSDAEYARPASRVDTSNFAPPSAEIIRKLFKVESLILTMMNRSHDTASVDERRHVYYNMLQYWLGVFKQYKPELIIFPVEPHGAYDYLIYELAQLFSVRTLFFSETRVSDRLLYMSDFRKGSSRLHEEMKKHRGENFVLEDLSKDLQEFYKKHVITGHDEAPPHIVYLKNKYSAAHRFSFEKIRRHIREGTFLRKVYIFVFKEKNSLIVTRAFKAVIETFKPNLKKEYEMLQTEPDLTKKFVYAALQVQPERSTSPCGDIFVDQILLIEMLSAALPQGWVIYVKEHPIQWIRIGLQYSSSRYPGYYKRIAHIRNVQLVPVELSTFDLERKAQAVVTVTGLPGWEALLRLTPALIFGYPWYMDFPGLFRVFDVESCRAAFNRIEKGFRVEKQTIINFLKSLDEATTHGYLSASNKKSSVLNGAENMESMTALIRKELSGKE